RAVRAAWTAPAIREGGVDRRCLRVRAGEAEVVPHFANALLRLRTVLAVDDKRRHGGEEPARELIEENLEVASARRRHDAPRRTYRRRRRRGLRLGLGDLRLDDAAAVPRAARRCTASQGLLVLRKAGDKHRPRPV